MSSVVDETSGQRGRALADGGEILATAETAALAVARPVTGLRSVTLKGFADPVEVVSITWS